jgi:hypothetical protein
MPNRPRKVSVIAPLAAENRGVLEEVQVEHRMVAAALPGQEDDEQSDAQSESTEDLRGGPAVSGRLDDGGEQDAERSDRQQGTARVGLGRRRVLRLGDVPVAQEQPDDHDRNVDQKDGPPPEVGQQKAAGDRAEPQPQGRDPGPDSDRFGPLLGVGEHVGQDRQRRRHDERPADAHQGAGADQHVGVGGERRQYRTGAEDDQPDGQNRYRPKRSPIVPVVSNSPANTIV